MTISELLPFLDFVDLAHFYGLNKGCKALVTPGEPLCLRFDVLFSKQKRGDIEKNTPEEWQKILATFFSGHSE